jgi:hypothetical protein
MLSLTKLGVICLLGVVVSNQPGILDNLSICSDPIWDTRTTREPYRCRGLVYLKPTILL